MFRIMTEHHYGSFSLNMVQVHGKYPPTQVEKKKHPFTKRYIKVYRKKSGTIIVLFL